MLKQQQLEQIGETFKKVTGMEEGTVRVDFVAQDGAQDAIVLVAGWKIAVSEIGDGRVSVAMGQLLKEAKFQEHGLWEVTLPDGEVFEANVLKHINRKLPCRKSRGCVNKF